jgi:hypothetical protein
MWNNIGISIVMSLFDMKDREILWRSFKQLQL